MPVTSFQARQASTKVINWPLSSEVPRPTMILRPSASVLICGSNGSVCHRFERIDRLHVVVAVEQHVGPAALRVVGDDHRMAGRGARGGVKALARQVIDQPFGGALALRGKGRIGRDRLDAQQGLEPIEALVEIGIDMGEDGVERGGGGGHRQASGWFGANHGAGTRERCPVDFILNRR